MNPSSPAWVDARQMLVRAYFPAAFLLSAAFVPLVNYFLYDPHGGIGFIVGIFVFPYALVELFRACRAAPSAARPFLSKVAAASAIGYIALSYPITLIATRLLDDGSSILGIGASLKPNLLWGIFTMPITLPFVWDAFT